MTGSVDQLTNMMEANRRLTLTLAEITQAGGETYIRIGSQAVTSLADQARRLTSGEVPGLSADAASPILEDLRHSREAAVKKATAAFADWQKAWSQAWAATIDQKATTEAFQSLLQPWKAILPTAGDGAKSDARTAKSKAAD